MIPKKDSLYEGAEDKLINAIHEVASLLEQTKIKTGETASYKFWKRIEGVMKYAWGRLQTTNWVHLENQTLKMELAFYRKVFPEMQQLVEKYQTIESMVLDGTLERDIAITKHLMEKGPDDK